MVAMFKSLGFLIVFGRKIIFAWGGEGRGKAFGSNIVYLVSLSIFLPVHWYRQDYLN